MNKLSNQSTISTIDAYIASCPKVHQALLNELRVLIKKWAPKEAKETINYKMPTIRYNGNLIHFALFKNHLGIYPGSAAIEYFKDILTANKTTKGAIQLPLDKPLPKRLIKQLVEFNISLLKNKQTGNWHVGKEKWVEANEIMIGIIEQTPLVKSFKWGMNVYTYSNKNVIAWSGFKNFFSVWFYNGVFLKDPLNVLISASEGKTKALRQWRFYDIKAMNAEQILSYIKESIQCIEDGQEFKPTKLPNPRPDANFDKALKENFALNKAYVALSVSKQREYCEYIEEAKQTATKERRLLKIIPMILEGKGLNDRYKK